MDIRRIEKSSVASNQITFMSKNAVSKDDCINPYEPFKGVDGNTYLIGYDSKLNNCTNCYAFAMGWREPAHNKYDDYLPGFLAGKPYSLENSARLVKEDLEKVGRKVYEILYDLPEELPEGEGYWIKFLYSPKKGALSAHFMRKDKKSGRWIHKMGWEMPPKVCVRNLEYTGVALTKSEIETYDSAGYTSINERDEITEYEVMWAMRISEP